MRILIVDAFRSSRAALGAGVACALALGGCAASEPEEPAAAGCTCKECGRCLVCLCNADLACVKVEIDTDTPRTTWNGKTYYFCSEECMQTFLKDPAKYAAWDAAKQ